MAENKFNFTWSPDTGFNVPDMPEPEDTPVRSEEPFDAPLKQRDLLQRDNLNAIRDYMIRRKGVQYREAEPTQVVDDFVENMRFFNTNLVSTAGEVRFVTNASDEDKEAARKAYELYDQLGNVFVNDGFFGAVEGIGEYVKAAAMDPSNYIGLLTGGVGKATALGVTTAGRNAVKAAVTEAKNRALASGATKAAADAAGKRAATATAARLAQRGVTGETADRVVRNVAKLERDSFMTGAASTAARGVTDPLQQVAARRSLYATTALDGTFGALNEHQIQNTMLEVGAQEEYSRTQTAFGSLFGLVGGGAQLLGRQAKGASGLGDTETQLAQAKLRGEQEFEIAFALDKTDVQKAEKAIRTAVDSWEAKYTRGSDRFDPNVTPTDLLHDIVLGEDGKGGLVALFRSKGLKLDKNRTVSDVMTNMAKQLPQDTLNDINSKLQKTIGVTLGETSELGITLGDLLAKDIRQSAQTLNIMSQARRTIDVGLNHGTNIIEAINKQADVQDALDAEKSNMNVVSGLAYGQSVWRRLLVSSPATSIINLVGFAQFNAGQSVADLFSSTGLGIAGLAMKAVNPEKGAEMLRMSRVYRTIQAQKMRNFMDPYTTHDAYMAFLKENKDVSKALFESYAGGVDRSVAKFGMDPDAKWFKKTEKFAEAANNITGVRIQDSFTKSQIFMTELDKNLQLTRGQSLADVMAKGTMNDIDDEVLGLTMDTTLKSVFSKNYTTDDQMLNQTAKFVESISNMPVLGTILPFGRFFNNVIGFTYQWGPLGLASLGPAIAKGGLKTKGGQAQIMEITSRAAVGSTALGLAMHNDEERITKGLAWNEVETGAGTIVDARNTFPLSLFLAAGRIANLHRKGENVPADLSKAWLEQLAVGQLVTDVQFGTDLNNLIDTFVNSGEGNGRASWDGLWKATGNIAAGFTRPLDPINKLVGYMDDSDAARDLRQAEGADIFTQASSRYVDNIFEAMFGKLDSITGEELRVATREGALYDPNPMARIFGIVVKPGRTSTEQAYSMANMAEWKASERSNMPEYDKIFNTFLAPRLESAMERLVRDKRYVEGSSDARQTMLSETLSAVRKDVRDYMSQRSPNVQDRLLSLRRKASQMGNATERREALTYMNERMGVDVSIQDMGYRELQNFMSTMDYLEDYNRTR